MKPFDEPCKIEYKCPWGVKPIVGMWSKHLNLYATDCICYTECPRRFWTTEKWGEWSNKQKIIAK